MAQFNFDATQVKPDTGRPAPIPVGKYRAVVTNTEMKQTANGAGMYLATEFKIIGGEHDGHTVYTNFNVQNRSEKAQAIGQAQFSALCHAVGVLNVQDTSQLHNRPFEVTVGLEAGGMRPDGNGYYEDRNNITGYFKEKVATQAAPVVPTAPVSAPKADDVPLDWFEANPVTQPARKANSSADSIAPPPWAV
jgi:hypothetical protein